MFMDEQKLDKFVDEINLIVTEELKMRTGLRSAFNMMGTAQKIELFTRIRGRIKYAVKDASKKMNDEVSTNVSDENQSQNQNPLGEENNSQADHPTKVEPVQPTETSFPKTRGGRK